MSPSSGVATLLLCLLAVASATISSQLLQSCREQCVERNIAVPLDAYDLSWPNTTFAGCDFQCHCRVGCGDLDEQSVCEEKCAATEAVAACRQGCHAIADAFISQIQLLVNQITVEADVDASLGQLQLNYTFDAVHEPTLKELSAANLQWVAQRRAAADGWRSTALGAAAFRDAQLHSAVALPAGEFASADVMIRLAAIWRDRMVTSRDVAFNFAALPLSASPPVLAALLQMSNDTMALCWEAVRGTATANGVVAADSTQRSAPKFRVSLRSKADDEMPLRAFETAARCHLFRHLPAENCCVATVEDVSDAEKVPAALKVAFELRPIGSADREGSATATPPKPIVVFTNGSTLLRMEDVDDFAMITDPAVVAFAPPDGQNITALSPLSQHELFVGISDGSIHLLDLDGPNATTIQREIRAADGVPIAQIAVDSVQKFLYAVRSGVGVIRCGLRDCREGVRVDSGPLQSVGSIAVDSWNGNLFYATTSGDVASTPLFPPAASDPYSLSITRRVDDLPPVAALSLDADSQRLIAALRNGSLFAVDLISRGIGDMRAEVERSDDYRAVVGIASLVGDRMIWMSSDCGAEAVAAGERCLRSEEKDPATGKLHLSTYVGGFGANVKDFAVLRDPLPLVAIGAVGRVGIQFGKAAVRVSWKPPPSVPFQPTAQWRQILYECRVTISTRPDSPIVGSALNVTEFSIPLESATATVSASVRVCVRAGPCSDWTNATSTATDGTKVAIWAKAADGELRSFDLAGEEFGDAVSSASPLIAAHFETVPRSAERHSALAFDPIGLQLYVASAPNTTISRRGTDSQKPFLEMMVVEHLAVLPRFATLIVASAYRIVAYRLTSSFQKVLYNCAEINCASVAGVTAADSTIYFLLRNTNGTVELHSVKFGADDNSPQLLAIADKFPQIRQIAPLGDRLALLTADGYVGTCDLRLSHMNLNFALREPLFLLPVTNAAPSLRSEAVFDGEVEFESSDAHFHWEMRPPQLLGDVMFKIEMIADTSTVEKQVDATLDNGYQLSNSLLNSWPSRQDFDAHFTALTPWRSVSIRQSSLRTPTKPPSPPMSLKIYATQQKTVDGSRAMIDLFWEGPEEWNGEMLGYSVQCNVTADDEGTPKPIAAANITARHSRAFFFSATSGKVSCAVAARNEQNLLGAYSEPATIDSSEFRPLVRLFAIDSNGELHGIHNWSITPPSQTTETMKTRQKRQSDSIQYQSVAFICNDLYAVRKELDTTQPILVLLDINDVTTVLHKVSINGEFSQISAMTSDWVANRLLLVGNQDLYQISLENLQAQSVVVPKQLIGLSVAAQDAKQLTYDPFTNTAYLLSKNGSVFALNLNKRTERNLGLHLDCLKAQTVTAIVGEFVWNKPTSPTLHALTWNGMITIDPLAMKCAEVNIDWAQFNEEAPVAAVGASTPSPSPSDSKPDSLNGLKAVTLFSVADKFFIFATATKLFVHDKRTGPVTQIPIQNPPLRQILAASHSSQPYPDRQCFALPSPTVLNFTVRNEDRTGAVVDVGEVAAPQTCPQLSFPPTQYQLHFRKKDTEKVKLVQSWQRVTHVENGILDKETDYEVYLSWSNRYFMPNGFSDIRAFRTGYGFPTAPLEPKAFALSPDTVLLYWKLPQTLNAPANEIKYKIKQSNSITAQPVGIGARAFLNGNFSTEFTDVVGCSQNPCVAKISNLRPATDYQFWITALHVQRMNPQLSEDPAATSVEALTRTKDTPGTLKIENTTSDAFMLRFASLKTDSAALPREVYVQYKETLLNHVAYADVPWQLVANSTIDPLAVPAANITIEGMRSATSYDVQLVASYAGSYEYDKVQKDYVELYISQPQSQRTKAGAPAPPQDVAVARDAEGWFLKWKAPADNGGLSLTFYAIDFRKNSTSDWTIAERGLPVEPRKWRIDRKVIGDEPQRVEFRVRAYNAEGFGAYAYTDPVMDPAESGAAAGWFWPSIVIAALLAASCAVCALLLAASRSRKQKAKLRKAKIHTQIRLDQIRYPDSFDNVPPELQNEVKNLPNIPRSHLRIEAELGKGSFGVVSQGIVEQWEPLGRKSVAVAVKVPKNPKISNFQQIKAFGAEMSASAFMKEAILMNNFDHPNIIRLLGVCLDDPPDQMLVMEYMAGGDLHKFLNAVRNGHQPSAVSLTMSDLISMIVDVGRGCAYLEMHRHVHRDLATRNCLISSQESRNRITKISDFGMAREMYSNDYYRLHSEGLLPLRWLSPEAARDGLFTSKSDVWAFGVLIWEILTLGHKPYHKLENSVVLQRICDGGNPGVLSVFPPVISTLMLQCWTVDREKRPSFAQLMPQLEKLRGMADLAAMELPAIQWTTYDNGGFNASSGSASGRSEPAHFDKSADYEVPRATAYNHGSESNLSAPIVRDSSSSGFGDAASAFGAYGNNGFELDENAGYEMLSRSGPPRYGSAATRPRPPPLNIGAGMQPSSRSFNSTQAAESPTRRTTGGARVSLV